MKSRIQVLLVEDDPESAQLTAAHVKAGEDDDLFRVEWADNLEKAMNRLTKPGVDVVLLDLGMPELGGYKTHLAITCAAGKKIPVVILTSDTDSISREITIEQGAASYLVKDHVSAGDIRLALHDAVVR